jgi:parallel beta-helix repeat protein
MKFKNTNLRSGIAWSIAVLLSASVTTSCQKDAQVTSPTTTTTAVVPSNSMAIANTTKSLATTYTSSAPVAINSKSNITISGLTINCNGGNTVGIQLQGCSNVHITNCKIYNSSTWGIRLYKCTNVTIDYCYVTNVMTGIYCQLSTLCKVNNNQLLNMNGPMGSFIQFDNISGGGNSINYNRCEDVAGVAKHPHDGISLYQSNGIKGDSITVFGNWIRGGQIAMDGGGACGIGLGDSGGSYQVARGNILVNPGYVGIQPQGGSVLCSNIKVDHNEIYSSKTAVSLLALGGGGLGSNVYMGYNYVNWTDSYGRQNFTWQWYSGTPPLATTTNVATTLVNANSLPATIITMN